MRFLQMTFSIIDECMKPIVEPVHFINQMTWDNGRDIDPNTFITSEVLFHRYMEDSRQALLKAPDAFKTKKDGQ